MTNGAEARGWWRRLSEQGPVRLYGRLGRWYAAAMLGGVLVTLTLTTAVGCYLWVRYDVIEPEGWPVAFVVSLGGVLAVLGITLWRVRHELAACVTWSGQHGPPSEALPTWRAALEFPLKAARRSVVPAVILLGGMTAFMIPRASVSGIDLLGVLIGPATFTAAGTVLAIGAAEWSLRPLVLELTPLLPSPGEAPPATLSLRARLLIAVPLLILACVETAIGLADDDADAGDLLGVYVVTMGLTALIGGGLTVLLAHAFTAPAGELVKGAERIAAGDLSEPVPVLAGDELGTVARSFNAAIEGLADRERLRGELQDSRARIVATSDASRRRVERDLHDGAQQHLVLLRLKLGLALKAVEAGEPGAADVVREAQADLDRALAELRDLAHGIYPAVLESEGLTGALAEAAGRAAIPVTVEGSGAGRYGPELEAAVYFCCLEALQNASKHAGAGARAQISLAESNGDLRFSVSDDGAGFDVSAETTSAGLQNMRDRIGALGGRVEIESKAGQGTGVSGSVPLGDRP